MKNEHNEKGEVDDDIAIDDGNINTHIFNPNSYLAHVMSTDEPVRQFHFHLIWSEINTDYYMHLINTYKKRRESERCYI